METSRLVRLAGRRIDEIVQASGVHEGYRRLAEDDAVKYAVGAMQPIDPVYTDISFKEGERVRGQIGEALRVSSVPVDFRFQGSVTNDTHIKAHSDIDLLAIRTTFHWVEPPLQANPPYEGDANADMLELRNIVTSRLRSSFPAAEVDTSSGKSVSICGGSLRRKVDVVPSAWWNTVAYSASGDEQQRGVKIFDTASGSYIENKPFLHNALIDARDLRFRGSLRKAARLLKSLKADAERPVTVSSYDLVSIVYRMDDGLLDVPPDRDLKLVSNVAAWLQYLIENNSYRNTLLVPNELRQIFCAEGCSDLGLRQMSVEVARLLSEVRSSFSRTLRNIDESRIYY